MRLGRRSCRTRLVASPGFFCKEDSLFQEKLDSNAEMDKDQNDDNKSEMAISPSSSISPQSRMNDYVTHFLQENNPSQLSSLERTIVDPS
jgi:hypothetical protein